MNANIKLRASNTPVWANTGKALRRCCSHFTWIAVLFMIAAMVVMTVQFLHVNGGHLPEHAPKVLPPGVLGLAGWADRLIVLANCSWVTIVAWQAVLVGGAGQQVRHATAAQASASIGSLRTELPLRLLRCK